MRTSLEAQQIERYRERGFLRLDRLLSADELAEVTDAVTGGVEELGSTKLAGVDPSQTEIGDNPGSWYDRVFLQVGSLLDDESQNPVVWSRTRKPTFV